MEQSVYLSDNIIGIIGIFLASAFLIWGAYKKIGALPLMLAGSLIVVIFNRMPLWHSFSVYFMRGSINPDNPAAIATGYLGFFMTLFLVFVASTVYTKAMEETGSIIKIGYKFSEWFGPKRAVVVVFATTAVLTYGGISLFVVVLAVAPLIMVLFKHANLPRSLAIGPLAAGAITFTMKSLPYSPQATNVIPTTFFGTNLDSGGAGAFIGILSAILMIAGQLWYFKTSEKKVREAGEGFTYMEGTKEENYEVDEDSLPSTYIAFLPLITVVGLIVGLTFIPSVLQIDLAARGIAPNAIVVGSMLFSTALTLVLNMNKIRDIEHLRYIINEGMGGAIRAISGPAAVVGFGGVVRASPAFLSIVHSLLNMEMNAYGMAAFGASVVGGVVGSSSAGLLISMEVLAEPLLASGANPGVLHRIAATFAGTFDSLPHSTVWFLIFPTLGVTHKEGYKHAFWTTVFWPTLAGLIVLVVAMVAFGY